MKIYIYSIVIIFSGFVFVNKLNAQTLFPSGSSRINYECTYKKYFNRDFPQKTFSITVQYQTIYESHNIQIIKCINFPFLKFVEFDIENTDEVDTSYLVVIGKKLFFYSFSNPYYLKLVNSLKSHLITDSSFVKAMIKTNFLLLNTESIINKYDQTGVFPYFKSEKIEANKYRITFKTRNDSEDAVIENGIGFSKLKYTWERNGAYGVNIVLKK